MAWAACLHELCANVGGVLAWVAWVACLPLIFQKDLKTDLKEEPDLKAGV